MQPVPCRRWRRPGGQHHGGCGGGDGLQLQLACKHLLRITAVFCVFLQSLSAVPSHIQACRFQGCHSAVPCNLWPGLLRSHAVLCTDPLTNAWTTQQSHCRRAINAWYKTSSSVTIPECWTAMPTRTTVKLISAEGYEFIIDYKAACVSNTIRNMLSSQGNSGQQEALEHQ